MILFAGNKVGLVQYFCPHVTIGNVLPLVAIVLVRAAVEGRRIEQEHCAAPGMFGHLFRDSQTHMMYLA
jgi:hypothetical protein